MSCNRSLWLLAGLPFVLLTLALTPVSAFVNPARQSLDAPWQIKSAQDFADSGEQISSPAYAPRGWMSAVVPGTVLGSYVHNGKYPEPSYDLNNKVTQNLIPDAGAPGTVFTYAHWYRTTFTLAPVEADRTFWLHLDGINYRADIYLNGQSVGKMAGMFKRGLFNVTGKAKTGRNVLAVKIYPLDVPGLVTGTGCGGNGQIGRNAAAMYATIGWDFTYPDGVRDRNMGIYRDTYLTTTGPVLVRDPFMITNRVPTADDDTADLTFKTYLLNATPKPVTGTLKLNIAGGLVTEPVTLLPNETREVTLTSDTHPGLKIAHPRLWWPIYQGNQELYNLTVSFVTTDSQISDALRTRFGIRTIRQDTSFHGQNTFWVNGRRLFIQGGNWVQDAMLKATKKDDDAKLRQIAQAGVNMLRCWSASAPESDDFYDLCDQYGILVWTESGAAAQVSGPDDHALQLDNWADVVLRIRNHPSQAYYCGGNEGWPIVGTGEVVAKYDGTRQYQDSSQQNGQRGAPYRWQGVNILYDYTDTDAYGTGPLGPFGGFCNETGSPVLPPAEVLRQQIPAAKLWPTTDNPAFDEAMNYHDGGGFHLVRQFVNAGCAQYGSFAAPDIAGRTGIENYAFKGQILGAAEYRGFSEVWKRNKWDEAHHRYDTGYMFWTINNPNPMVAARLANYSGEPNAALFYFAHGNKPLHTQYDYFYNDVSVINDHPISFHGLTVTAEVRNLDWSLKWHESKSVDVAADQSLTGALTVPAKDTPGFDDVHFVVVSLHDASGALLDRMIYWRAKNDPKYGADGPFTALNTMPPARLKVSASMHRADGRQVVAVVLRNPTPHLAFFTRLKLTHGKSQSLVQPTEYSDDYFSILPAETKTVTLTYDPADLAGEAPQLTVEGWNLHSLTLGLNGTGITSDAPSAYKPPLVPISQGKPVTASSTEETGNVATNVTDDNLTTRWASRLGHDPEWITVDLGASHAITEIRLDWENAAAKDYLLQSSEDGIHWATLRSVTGNALTGWVSAGGLHAQGRYVRIYCTARVTPWGYSLYEFQVYGH